MLESSHQINPTPAFLRKIILLLPFNPRAVLNRILIKNAANLKIVLDVACGHGGNAIVTRYHNPNIRIIGFNIFSAYLIECKALDVYDDILIADVRALPFREKSVDAVYFTETIEHLEKSDGERSLEELEIISRKAVLITTPIGLTLRCKEEVKNGNVYQLHRSGWLPTEFTKWGYRVWGRYPHFLRRYSILLFFPPFILINLIRLPLCASTNIVALKTFDK